MDRALVDSLLDRDWAPFLAQARRLGLGRPRRQGTRIALTASPSGSHETFRAVLL